MFAAIVTAIPAIIQMIMMIVGAIKKTPEEKRVDFINELSIAMRKVKIDGDPKDLARLISNL